MCFYDHYRVSGKGACPQLYGFLYAKDDLVQRLMQTFPNVFSFTVKEKFSAWLKHSSLGLTRLQLPVFISNESQLSYRLMCFHTSVKQKLEWSEKIRVLFVEHFKH